MCKLLKVVYLFLLLVIDELNTAHDSPLVEKRHKHSKHRHSKTRHAANEVARKTSEVTDTTPTTEQLIIIVEENNTEDPIITDDVLMFEELENGTDKNEGMDGRTGGWMDGRTGNSTKTFVGNLTTHHEAESSSTDDYSNSSIFDEEVSNNGDVSNDANNLSNNGTKEIVKHTPYRKSMSQDAVLDLKARSGHVSSEEDDSEANSNLFDLSNNENYFQHSTDLRTGYIPTDEVDTSNADNYAQQMNRLVSQSNYQPEFNYPRPDRYNAFQNYRQRYSPLYFESSDSREVNPIMNRDIWGNGITGQQIKSYNGFSKPSNQYGQGEICTTCTTQGMSSREHGYRRITDEKSDNGRSGIFDPSSANAYPLEQENGIYRVQDPNEVLTSGTRRAYVSQEVGRNAPLNRQPDASSLSKYLMTLPSQFLMNRPRFLRRPGLGGVQRYIV